MRNINKFKVNIDHNDSRSLIRTNSKFVIFISLF